jgi:hypothetical protein
MLDLSVLAKYVTAFGVIAAAAISAENRYAPASAMGELKAELRVDRIFDLTRESEASGGPDWLCRAIDKEFVTLCSEYPSHYLCIDPDARKELKARAKC